jgi:hypothetical protein
MLLLATSNGVGVNVRLVGYGLSMSGYQRIYTMIALCTNMSQYYVQVDGIPQFIMMMDNAQKKAKCAGMLIANMELVMMALAAVLAAQYFLC